MDAEAAVGRVVNLPDTSSAPDVLQDMLWLEEVLHARLQLYLQTEQGDTQSLVIPAPDLANSRSPYANAIREAGFTLGERLVFLLALCPNVYPQLLDALWLKNPNTDRGYTEFGGLSSAQHSGFIPTVETALFLLAGDEIATRLACMPFFDEGGLLRREQWLTLGNLQAGEPFTSASLSVPYATIMRVLQGHEPAPRFGSDFPARKVDTALNWQDLVLPEPTLEQLEEIKHWLMHGQTLLHDWRMIHRLRPGYTALFVGPSGTGKTLTACLLGQHCGRDVYRIDLSMVVSKYIGETEKNLAAVFDAAEHKGWILFFDEADALFGKRTKVSDAHDRYANQEVSFLLQRIEEFSGVVILASNFRENIDEAFLRRFHSVVNFPLPKAHERLRLWQEAIPPEVSIADDVNLAALAERHEITGGVILNVIRFALLRSLSRDDRVLRKHDVEQGVRRELLKSGQAL